MNRLRVDNAMTGGYPFELDDLEFEQLAIREAFSSIFSGLTGEGDDEGMRVSGCEVTLNAGTVFDVSAGWLYLNGEFFKVDAHQYDTAGGTPYWEIQVTFDPAGSETFEDLSTKDTYEVRRAKVVVSGSPPATITVPEAPTYADKVKEAIGFDALETQVNTNTSSIEDAWISIPDGNVQGEGAMGVSGGQSFGAYKIMGKTMIINYSMSVLTFSGTANKGVNVLIPGGESMNIAGGTRFLVGSGHIGDTSFVPCRVIPKSGDPTRLVVEKLDGSALDLSSTAIQFCVTIEIA